MDVKERLITAGGHWAKTAQTEIPIPPVPGVAYRNASLSALDIENGQAYDKVFDSARYNQFLYQMSGLVQQLEQYGVLPYSEMTDYKEGALCISTDGKILQAVKASGPGTGAGAKGTDKAEYWQDLFGPLWAEINALKSNSGNTAQIVNDEIEKLRQSFNSALSGYMPKANTSGSRGHVTSIILGDNGDGTLWNTRLPAGGSWFYYIARFNGSDNTQGIQIAGVAPGNHVIYSYGEPVQLMGFAWRIA